jgi:PIN domain nuclease of toxin-antitoxin system
MKYVLDACSLIAFFDNEEGCLTVSDLLLTPRAAISMTAINMCEVLYHVERTANRAVANQALKHTLSLGIEIIDELDPKVWREAAHLKAVYRRLSLADAIGVAYAKKIRGYFVTSDHAELEPLATDKVASFFFFR